jgi:hypothetical protein
MMQASGLFQQGRYMPVEQWDLLIVANAKCIFVK